MPSVGEIARAVGGKVIGDEPVSVTSVASVRSASSGSIVFVEDGKHLEAALKSAATAVITGPFAENIAPPKPLLLATHPKLAFPRPSQVIGGGSAKNIEKR